MHSLKIKKLKKNTEIGESRKGAVMWLTVALITGILLALGLAALSLARLNIVFTTVEEGQAKAILRNGGFERIIMQFAGKRIDKNGEVVTGNEYHILGGFRLIGIPLIHSLHEYHFRWKTFRPQTGKVEDRDRLLDYILVKDDVYVAEVESAESKGMVPLDIGLLITAKCINPYKAMFVAQDWMEMLISRSEAIFREYVAGSSFEELVAKKQKAGEELFAKCQETGLLAIFKEEYGIEVKGIEMQNINPSGEKKEMFTEAATKKWQAEQEAQRIGTIAKAEQGRIETVYETIQKFGDLGVAVRFMESIDSAGNKAGNWIIPPTDLMSAARNIMGKSGDSNPLAQLLTKEGITYQELKALIDKSKGGRE